MNTTLSQKELSKYVIMQLETFFPDGHRFSNDLFCKGVETALFRCEECFKHILIPGYCDNNGSVFSHLHMDQYASFLYFLSNTLYMEYGIEAKNICDKIINLNRLLNGLFLSYKCPMPKIFILAHPVGSVIGNANYSDGLYISQNVTINTHTDDKGNIDLNIGKGFFCGAGAKIIGNKNIGDRVSVGVNTLIYNKKVVNDSVCCMNDEGNLIIRKRKSSKCMAARVFDLDFD